MRTMVVVRALKDILSIKIKTRHDSYCDQFNRLFMTKMLLISSVIMGFDYFSDRVSCMVPKTSDLSKDFIHSACWISGFYIYKEMKDRLDKSGYYGIPQRVDHDGINDRTWELCLTKDQFSVIDKCIPMTRLYYLHYQWMPFYIGALAVFFYLPYILFRMVNTDLVSLKTAIKSLSGDTDLIVKNYFNYKVNSLSQLRLRIWWNISVKVLYVFVSLAAFYLTDYLLMGHYRTYGKDYLDWSEKNTSSQHVAINRRNFPKAGNVLLPSMGLCDISEASKDTRTTFHNENRFICEISPNILYQYVLMVLWFFFVASISISIVGLASYICSHVYRMIFFGKASPKKTIYRYLTLREIEYLQFIKKKNMITYGDVMRKLKLQRCDLHGKIRADDYEASNDFVSKTLFGFTGGYGSKTTYHNGQYFSTLQKTDSYNRIPHGSDSFNRHHQQQRQQQENYNRMQKQEAYGRNQKYE